jgi:hypothetical protein
MKTRTAILFALFSACLLGACGVPVIGGNDNSFEITVLNNTPYVVVDQYSAVCHSDSARLQGLLGPLTLVRWSRAGAQVERARYMDATGQVRIDEEMAGVGSSLRRCLHAWIEGWPATLIERVPDPASLSEENGAFFLPVSRSCSM